MENYFEFQCSLNGRFDVKCRPFRTVLGTVFVVAFDALSEQLVEKLGYSTTV